MKVFHWKVCTSCSILITRLHLILNASLWLHAHSSNKVNPHLDAHNSLIKLVTEPVDLEKCLSQLPSLSLRRPPSPASLRLQNEESSVLSFLFSFLGKNPYWVFTTSKDGNHIRLGMEILEPWRRTPQTFWNKLQEMKFLPPYSWKKKKISLQP